MVEKLKKESTIWSGFGLILGAAVGTLAFVFTMQAVFIGFGAALGLVFGSIISLQQKETKELKK